MTFEESIEELEGKKIIFTLDAEQVKKYLVASFPAFKETQPTGILLSGTFNKKENPAVYDFDLLGKAFRTGAGFKENILSFPKTHTKGVLEVQIEGAIDDDDFPDKEVLRNVAKQLENFSRIGLLVRMQNCPWTVILGYEPYYIMAILLKKCGTIDIFDELDKLEDFYRNDPHGRGRYLLDWWKSISRALIMKDVDLIFEGYKQAAAKLYPDILKEAKIPGGLHSRIRSIFDRTTQCWPDYMLSNNFIRNDDYFLSKALSQFGHVFFVPNHISISAAKQKLVESGLLKGEMRLVGLAFYNPETKKFRTKLAKLCFRNFQNTQQRLIELYAFLDDQLKKI